MSVFNGKVGINLRLSAIPVIFQTIKKSVFISLLSLVLSLSHSLTLTCARDLFGLWGFSFYSLAFTGKFLRFSSEFSKSAGRTLFLICLQHNISCEGHAGVSPHLKSFPFFFWRHAEHAVDKASKAKTRKRSDALKQYSNFSFLLRKQ